MSNKNSAKTSTAKRKPVVLMSMGAQERKGHDYQVMTHKYITPLVEIAGCVPVLVPTCCGTDDLEQYLDMADGVYLTGAGSNIDPTLYGQENLTPEKGQDRDRDLFDLPLIKAAIARGLPVFGICRGMQLLNVVLGGVLHLDNGPEANLLHRGDDYGRFHRLDLVTGTLLHRIVGRERSLVNSQHHQSISRLAAGLAVNARCETMIEGLEWQDPAGKGFLLGVQWHPEAMAKYGAETLPTSRLVRQAFLDAATARRAAANPG